MNIIKSIFTYQCPRCRSAKMFKKPFKFSAPLAMHKHCPNCGLDLEPQPGYYWGAMFLSYIISGFAFLLPALALVFGFGWSVNAAMAFVIAFAALTYFKLLRLSRSLWIHINVKYQEELATKK